MKKSPIEDPIFENDVGTPTRNISFIIDGLYLKYLYLSFIEDFPLNRWISSHNIPTNIDITVAMAAPLTPSPKVKINIGSKITLITAETNMAFIDVFMSPIPRKIPLETTIKKIDIEPKKIMFI